MQEAAEAIQARLNHTYVAVVVARRRGRPGRALGGPGRAWAARSAGPRPGAAGGHHRPRPARARARRSSRDVSQRPRLPRRRAGHALRDGDPPARGRRGGGGHRLPERGAGGLRPRRRGRGRDPGRVPGRGPAQRAPLRGAGSRGRRRSDRRSAFAAASRSHRRPRPKIGRRRAASNDLAKWPASRHRPRRRRQPRRGS